MDEMTEETDKQPAPQAFKDGVVKCAVWYDYWRPDGTKGSNRVFYEGVATLRTAQQVVDLEKQLLEAGRAEGLVRLLITGWQSLEG